MKFKNETEQARWDLLNVFNADGTQLVKKENMCLGPGYTVESPCGYKTILIPSRLTQQGVVTDIA